MHSSVKQMPLQRYSQGIVSAEWRLILLALGQTASRDLEKSCQKKLILALERREPLRNFYFVALWNICLFLNDPEATSVCRSSKLDYWRNRGSGNASVENNSIWLNFFDV